MALCSAQPLQEVPLPPVPPSVQEGEKDQEVEGPQPLPPLRARYRQLLPRKVLYEISPMSFGGGPTDLGAGNAHFLC